MKGSSSFRHKRIGVNVVQVCTLKKEKPLTHIMHIRYKQRMSQISILRSARHLYLIIAAVFLTVCAVTRAQELSGGLDPEIERELQFAEALTQMGLPNYAEKIIDRIKDPAARPMIEVLRIRGDLARGDFDAVKKLISSKPNQKSQDVWALKLALADGYYAWGRYPEAQGIYNSFFDAYPNGPPDSLNSFYMDSAYKYSQMLMLMGNNKAALGAYRNILKAEVPRAVERQVMTETAELAIKVAEGAPENEREALFKEVEEILNKILWVQDLWFGKGIVIMAHMRMLQGDIDGTMELIDLYKPQLIALDESLKEQNKDFEEDITKLSPMAECRFLLGVILQDEAELLLEQDPMANKARIVELLAGKPKRGKEGERTSGALQHFLNVFIRYPNTPWAPEAGTRVREVEEILTDRYDAKIKKSISDEQMEDVKKAQFVNARTLFNQQQLDKAIEAYVPVLNLFPEGPTPLAALGELARCYIETSDDQMAQMTIRYLAERFGSNAELQTDAGDKVLGLALMYSELQRPDREQAIYELYFKHFRNHPRIAATLFRFGNEHFEKQEYDKAMEYFQQIADDYSDQPIWDHAMSKVAYCYYEKDDHVNEIKTLESLIEKLEKKAIPGHALVNAKFRVAFAYKELGPKYIPSAFNRYLEIIKMLGEGADSAKYAKTSEEEKGNSKTLEAAMFYKAVCYSMLDADGKKKQQYQLMAIRSLEELIEAFPKSEFAPIALSQIGTLWTILEQPSKAEEALQKLQSKYPDSTEARNALFTLGMNLLKLDQRKRAITVFKQMFEGNGQYSDTQILRAGEELQKAGEYEIALDAMNKVLQSTGPDQRALWEPAMVSKGELLVETGAFREGAETLEKVFEAYPMSGFTVQAARALSKAYAELAMREADKDPRFDLFNQAVSAIKKVSRFDKSPGAGARTEVNVARILVKKARAEEEFGTAERAAEYKGEAIAAFQTLVLLRDPSDTHVRPHIEDAYHECLPLLMEIGKWEDALADCDKYLEEFSTGRYVLDVRKWRNRAMIEVKTKQTTASIPASATGAGPAE
jgi:tetratricopeptide (TPR) repeat protein